MRGSRVSVIVLGLLAAAGWSASAQAAPSPGGPVQRGFSPQVLVAQLSLYLPEEATRGMFRGLRGGASGAGAQGAPGAGASSAGGRGFPQVPFTRDPALFLTKDQVTKLLPVLRALREAPFPTPSRARQIQADVDAQLTAGQKAEWEDFQKRMRAAFEEFRKRMAASGGAAGPGGTMAGGGPDGPGGGGGGAAGPSPSTMLERRQKQLDAFIEVLQGRLK